MKQTGLLALVLVSALGVACNRSTNADRNATANPNGTPGATATSGSGVSSSDSNFVRDVTELNNAEIDLSRDAADRSTNPDVKKFAQMVITDHTAAGDKLSSVVASNNIPAAPANSDKAENKREDLDKKQGADFDRAYIDAMIDGHDKLMSKLDSRVDKKGSGDAATVVPEKSDNAVTQSVNQWAADTFTAAKGHRDQAKALKDALKK
jgi:putative membrane protein